MFKNEFQGGAFFEVFSAQGKDSTAQWRILGNPGVRKFYDKEVKSYVYSLEGASATTKMMLPKDMKQPLKLVQRFLIFQLCVDKGQDFAIELGMADFSKNKRRLLLSTNQKELHSTPLHAKVPLTIMKRAIWVNLCLDMVSLLGETWRQQTYQAVESITLSANCRIRRIFTMKVQPPDTTDNDDFLGSNTGELDMIPHQCQLSPDVMQVTQVLSIAKVKQALRGKSGDMFSRPGSMLELDLISSGRKSSGNDSFRIAFGSKVAAPANAASSLKSAREGNSTTRSRSGYSGTDDVYGETSLVIDRSYNEHTEEKENGNAFTRNNHDGVDRDDYEYDNTEHYHPIVEVDRVKDDNLSVRPHPPREPSSDRVRRRIRIKAGSGGNRDRQSSAGSGKDEPTSSRSQSLNNRSNVSLHPDENRKHDIARLTSEEDLLDNIDLEDRLVSDDSQNEDSSDDMQHNNDNRAGSTCQRWAGRGSEDAPDPARYDEDSGESQHTREGRSQDIRHRNINYNANQYAGRGDSLSKTNTDYSIVQSHYKTVHRIVNNEGRDADHNQSYEDEDASHFGQESDAPNQLLDLTDQSESSEGSESDSAQDLPGEYEESEDEDSRAKDVYLFASPPKSARRRNPGNTSPTQLESESHYVPKRSSSKSMKSSGKSSMLDVSRGARPEDDFINSEASSDEDYVQTMAKKPESRPHSGTSITSGSSPKTGCEFQKPGQLFQNSGNEHMPDGKAMKALIAKEVSSRPENKPQFRGHQETLASPLLNIPRNKNLSRLSRKSLREIPSTDARFINAKSSEKPYDANKYKMADFTSSTEARMLASMQQHSPTASPRHHPAESIRRNMYDESPNTTSDDDTSFSTWKAPAMIQGQHNYQDEMRYPTPRQSNETLASSNPRDWNSVFSPPIILPGDMRAGVAKSDDLTTASVDPGQEAEGYNSNEELDLLYDPCLNCYYDPRNCRYYELM